MLSIESLSHRYAAAAQPALQEVSLGAARGEVLGLLGPNGAGKTTLISHLAGLLAIQQGRILIDGEPLEALRRRAPTTVAVAPQEYAFYPMLSVLENLECFAGAARLGGARRRARVAHCLAFAQLERFAGVRAERLSGGLKRRLNLAIALLPAPELILFDEPTVGVDPQSRAFLLEAIARLAHDGAAVIYTSHYMEEIEAIAQRVVIIDQGRVLRAGRLEELLAEGGSRLRIEARGLDPATLKRFGTPTALRGGWELALKDGLAPGGVLAQLESEGHRLLHGEFGRRDLEQVFMALTHRSLRD